MSEVIPAPSYSTYEDGYGPAIVCDRCKYHSRRLFDINRKHCPICLAYHTEEGTLLMRNIAGECGYRMAWVQWCIATNPKAKALSERCMDQLQSTIGRNPTDPRYYYFVRSLPGFVGMWENLSKKMGGMPPGLGD